MTDNSNILKAEDYIEPRCVLCDEPYGAEPAAKSVPQRRIIEKMDEYMSLCFFCMVLVNFLLNFEVKH